MGREAGRRLTVHRGNIGLGAGVNYLTGPGINTDLWLQKTFQMTEHKSLQLRADAFNTFNHTQFSGYNTNSNFSRLSNPTVTNLFLKADGTINNLNGFGTVNGARSADYAIGDEIRVLTGASET